MLFALCSAPLGAHAAWGLVDGLDLSPFVPIVLDSFMSIAMAGYEFFVGKGDGIIYLFVWGWLGFFIGMYLVKMYLPPSWLSFFGMKGGQMWEGKASALKISEDLVKPALRGIIAAGLLLQVKPQYVTQVVVDPFLRFGALYTHSISEIINKNNEFAGARQIECPENIIKKEYISKESCQFLVQPVADITHVNNQIIKRGLTFITSGLTGMANLVPNGGRDLLNLITGIFLVFAFVSSNFFMALLIIQGIFEFGMALMLYPFKVLMFVAKDSDKWIDPWPAFGGIIDSLKKLVITMIACVFILAINIAAVRALFNFNGPAFSGNGDGAMGFGGHSIVWLSALLTFFLMFKIFDETKEQLMKYTGADKDKSMTKLYDNAKADTKTAYKNVNEWGKKAGKALGWVKGK